MSEIDKLSFEADTEDYRQALASLGYTLISGSYRISSTGDERYQAIVVPDEEAERQVSLINSDCNTQRDREVSIGYTAIQGNLVTRQDLPMVLFEYDPRIVEAFDPASAVMMAALVHDIYLDK
jgi:hypothetical protein